MPSSPVLDSAPSTSAPSPSSATCRDCAAPLHGPWCAQCGQRDVPLDPPFRELVRDAAVDWVQDLLHVEGKLLRTLRVLLRPGALTLEHAAGRRTRYVTPRRLYLTCSVFFFLLAAALPTPPVAPSPGKDHVVQVGPLRMHLSPKGPEQLVQEAQAAHGLERLWLTHLARARADTVRLQQAADSTLPKAMFALMPVFALILHVAYRRKGLRYVRHLTFALHVHAFAFLLLPLVLLARLSGSAPLRQGVTLAVAWAVMGYLYLAMRRVYGEEGRRATSRFGVVLALYGLTLFGGMLATLAVLVFTF